MMVSANSASCTPAEPMTAGPSATKKRLTSASQRGRRNLAITSLHAVSPATNASSRHPAISTPQAAAWPAVGNNAASASVIIIVRLSRMGAAAAAANRLSALRMPP